MSRGKRVACTALSVLLCGASCKGKTKTAEPAAGGEQAGAADESSPSSSACATKIYGRQSAPVEVRLSTPKGERIYRLPRVRATVYEDDLSVALPSFGTGGSVEDARGPATAPRGSQIRLWAEAPEGEGETTSAGIRWDLRDLPSADCLGFPSRLELEDQTLTIEGYRSPGDQPGKLEAHLEVVVDDDSQSRMKLTLQTEQLFDISNPRPVSEDTGVRNQHTNDDTLETFEQGQLTYHPDREKLHVKLTSGSGMLGFRLNVPEEPGIYVGRAMDGKPLPIIVVEAMEGSHMRVLEYALDRDHYAGELPEHPLVLLPAKGLTREVLEKNGQLEKRLETHHLVQLTSLAPVELAAE